MELGFWSTIGVSIWAAGITVAVSFILVRMFRVPKRVETMERVPQSQS